MSDTFPMVFREMQIKSFCDQAEAAGIVYGPNQTAYADAHIESVIEEVKAGEADLTSARVSIEHYLINELKKDPNNVVFMRMSDAFRPIFDEVIAIEVKMFGAPKFIVSRETDNATAWRMDAAATTPINTVSLPQDVLAEAAQYSFTTFNPADYVLPDEAIPIDANTTRRDFFAALPADDSNELREEEWLKNFKREASYELIDRAIFLSNFHDQVSFAVLTPLREYALVGFEAGLRDDDMIKYENECPVHKEELVPENFIVTAGDASKRALFTLLQVTGEQREQFAKFLKDHEKFVREVLEMPDDEFIGTADERIQKHESSFVFERAREEMVDSLIQMYGKLPIFERHMNGFKILFKYLSEDKVLHQMLNHFYLCYNDMISYYEERNFFESATRCNNLKDLISELAPQEPEPTPEEIEVKVRENAEKRANEASGSVFISD